MVVSSDFYPKQFECVKSFAEIVNLPPQKKIQTTYPDHVSVYFSFQAKHAYNSSILKNIITEDFNVSVH